MKYSEAHKDDHLLLDAVTFVMVGLFVGDREVNDPQYQRQPLAFGVPQGQTDIRYVESTAEIVFPDTVDEFTVDSLGFFDSTGVLRGMDKLEEPRQLSPDFRVFFKAGEIKIGVP